MEFIDGPMYLVTEVLATQKSSADRARPGVSWLIAPRWTLWLLDPYILRGNFLDVVIALEFSNRALYGNCFRIGRIAFRGVQTMVHPHN